MKCRFCRNPLTHGFIDLVNAPPSNSFLTREQLDEPEIYYPLKLFVCDACHLVQIDEYKKSGDIFTTGYIYFSSFSKTWLEHAQRYADTITKRLQLSGDSLVVEVASNDGYLLQYFIAQGIPCVGIEPAENCARAARQKGIEVIGNFFGSALADSLQKQGRSADLIVGNNVLAHVPDLTDFVSGLRMLLKPTGMITLEFPHLMRLVEDGQFDTIYHEHFSYFSFHTVKRILEAHGLAVCDVEKLPTHGGSLRVYAGHGHPSAHAVTRRVGELVAEEMDAGMGHLDYYLDFQEKVDGIKNGLVSFLLECRRKNKTVAGYGAAAKGNTLLNYCGIKKDLVPYVVDASPHKQGKYLPGNHIPVVSEDVLIASKADYILILPWNIRAEIMDQLAYVHGWNASFVTAVPELTIYPS